MAIGMVLLTLPIALLASAWMMATHSLNVLQALGVYSGFGAFAFLLIFLTTVLALRDIR